MKVRVQHHRRRLRHALPGEGEASPMMKSDRAPAERYGPIVYRPPMRGRVIASSMPTAQCRTQPQRGARDAHRVPALHPIPRADARPAARGTPVPRRSRLRFTPGRRPLHLTVVSPTGARILRHGRARTRV